MLTLHRNTQVYQDKMKGKCFSDKQLDVNTLTQLFLYFYESFFLKTRFLPNFMFNCHH